MSKEHKYLVKVEWTGNRGTGTSGYGAYGREHTVNVEGKTELQCSSDPAFRGDKSKHNPEDMLVASISTCHMLWFLHLCADAGIIVTEYTDDARGRMVEDPDGGGHFESVTLNPVVKITDEKQINKANSLHEPANKKCFISNSCNFPIYHKPTCIIDHIGTENT